MNAPLLKVQQVAERLSCSIATVYSLIERRILPSVKIGAGGGGVRVSLDDLNAFIESRRTCEVSRVRHSRFKHLR